MRVGLTVTFKAQGGSSHVNHSFNEFSFSKGRNSVVAPLKFVAIQAIAVF
jgi:hypothetical protein